MNTIRKEHKKASTNVEALPLLIQIQFNEIV